MTTGMEGVQVISLSLGYVMGQALHTAAELGVADVLADGPRSIDEIAAETGTHAPSMRRLMRTLASGGIFTETGVGRYALTAMGDTLRSDVPGSVRAAVVWVGEPMHYATCGDLTATVKTGSPAFDRLYGRPYFDALAGDTEAGRVWDEGMACFSSMENTPIASAYDFPHDATIVDIGGGQGGFLVEVLRTDPSLRGVLFDLAEVVEKPRELTEAGLLDRCSLVSGSFFEALPPGGDLYVFKRVMHDWDDDTCVRLLKLCRDVIASDGRLLIVDAVIPAGDDPHPAKIVDMVMMGVLTGRERTEDEFSQLLIAAGFTLDRVIPTHSMLAIVEATPI
jgi:O-methyltransferase domain/Dimerisation domain